MPRCAMCDSPAITTFFVLERGVSNVCGHHFRELSMILMKKSIKENMQRILKRIIMNLNQQLAAIPPDRTPDLTPAKIQRNRGMRSAFKAAVKPVEDELEKLIRE